jgi:AcrR family transcriptional regulator
MWSMSTSKKAPPRRKRPDSYHHGDLRRALVATATQMLENEEAENLSLREVARRAGVSHNAPYRHFADRDSLLAAVAAEGFRALGQTMAESRSASAQPLRAIGEAYVQFAIGRPRLFGLMFGPGLERSRHPELAAAMDEVFAHLAQPLGGNSADDGARPTLVAAWSLVHGLAHLLIDHRLGPRLRGSTQDVNSLIGDVLDAAGRGIQSADEP